MQPRILRDRYEIRESLGGRGGSATYLALDRASSTPCVVKELSVREVVRSDRGAHSFDADDFTKPVELFEREASVLAHLDHPGIPRLVDHFTDSVDGDTRLYTVQEYVDGDTLEALVSAGRHFSEREARQVCRRVAEILAYLHDRAPPLIHRDVKPSNIVLDGTGAVHLVDFGSVRSTVVGEELDGKTIVGTYGYMPIEQYEARALPQSDLYALGMTLVFMLTHREPTRIPRTGMRLDFREYANVSPGFADILERMIEPAPEDRYESAGALLGALRGGDRGRVPFFDVARPGRSVGTALSAVAVAALGIAGAWTMLARASERSEYPPPPPEAITPSGGPTPVAASPVRPEGDVLSLDLYRDFRYRPQGWPMGRSVTHSALPELSRRAVEELRTPPGWRDDDADVWYGFFPLGNAADTRIAFALSREVGGWALHVDSDNDESLLDEGPPTYNEGSGPLLAAAISVEVDVVTPAGELRSHPYHLWAWFDENDRGAIRGRFYARNHFLGVVEVNGSAYDVVAFEFGDHDALYRASGLCIDLDGDGECQEALEHFHDGDSVTFPGDGGTYRLELRYP